MFHTSKKIESDMDQAKIHQTKIGPEKERIHEKNRNFLPR